MLDIFDKKFNLQLLDDMISSQVMIKVIQIVGLSIPRPGKIKRSIISNSVSDQKCRNFNHPGPCSEVVAHHWWWCCAK